eukprot:1050413-Prymnesium_polylepis.2
MNAACMRSKWLPVEPEFLLSWTMTVAACPASEGSACRRATTGAFKLKASDAAAYTCSFPESRCPIRAQSVFSRFTMSYLRQLATASGLKRPVVRLKSGTGCPAWSAGLKAASKLRSWPPGPRSSSYHR